MTDRSFTLPRETLAGVWAPRPRAELSRRCSYWAPIIVILAAQALLTARLIRTSTASGDEGRYIYAGHQLIHELWHGGGSPYYETYFSGAPVIYPVLAAMADHVGGLAAVRLMSLSFMLAATSALFGAGRRLFGYWAGLAAAALFAGLGLTQDLGGLATHDALALLLTGLAAYCAVGTGEGEPLAGQRLVLVPLALLAANATKYATLLFDPIVIGLSALQLSSHGWRRVTQRLGALGMATAALLALAVFLAGNAYVNGLLFSTLARKKGASAIFAASPVPAPVILSQSWHWIGAVVAMGAVAVGVAITQARDRRAAAQLTLLVTAAALVTVESLRLHTVESMRKHDDIGAWFTCIAAGYLIARLGGLARNRLARAPLAAVLSAAVVVTGAHYSLSAASTYEAKTSTAKLSAFVALKPYLELKSGRFLIGGLGNEQMVYTDALAIPWYRLFDDIYLKYPVPGRGGDSHGQKPGLVCQVLRPGCVYLEGIAGFREAIHAHWFTVVSMIGSHHIRRDAEIIAAVRRTPGYVLLTHAGGAPTWIYAPDYRALVSSVALHVPAPATDAPGAAAPPASRARGGQLSPITSMLTGNRRSRPQPSV